MKKIFYYAAIALFTSAMGLTSCQNEDDLTHSGTDGKEVHVTVNVTREGFDNVGTRTSLKENEGDLLCTWSMGDQLLVTNTSGQKLGTLQITEGIGENKATFDGVLVGLKDGSQTLNFFYLGTKADIESIKSSTFDVDFSGKEGTLESLSDHDILSSSIEVNVDNGAFYVEDLELKRNFAFGHFELQFSDGATIRGTEEVKISGENFKSSVTVDLTNATYTSGEGNVIVKGKGNDFYIMLVPTQDVTLGFSVTIGEVEYAGSLIRSIINASDFYRDGTDNNNGVPVKMKPTVTPTIDGSIFNLMWAPCNTRSWIDWAYNNEYAYLISYIPTIPFKEQGISLHYDNSLVFTDTDNALVYHYQWDRDFGFIASDEAYNMGITYLPNNYPNRYYFYAAGTATLEQSNKNYDKYIYPTSNDWCSTSRVKWENRFYTDEISPAPAGYHIPTYAEWKRLLPEGENKLYTYSLEYEVDGGTAYPFFVKNEDDGTSIIWSMWQTSNKKYLDIRRVAGTYRRENIDEDILSQCSYPLQLPADGYRSNKGTMEWQERGLYWASDSPNSTEGKAYCFSFKINESDQTIEVAAGVQPRKFAFSIRCIKDNLY